MYIILDHGEFEKGGKPTGKNIEVSVLVLDSDGSILQNAVFGAVSSLGSASEEYQSVILYHHNCPKWGETIRLSVPIEKFPDTHVRIEYRHCSSKA
jgi:dedicator of cytokinesis protein 3